MVEFLSLSIIVILRKTLWLGVIDIKSLRSPYLTITIIKEESYLLKVI